MTPQPSCCCSSASASSQVVERLLEVGRGGTATTCSRRRFAETPPLSSQLCDPAQLSDHVLAGRFDDWASIRPGSGSFQNWRPACDFRVHEAAEFRRRALALGRD